MKSAVTVTVVGYDRDGNRWEEEVDAVALEEELQRQKEARGNTQYLTTAVGEAIAKLTGLQASGARILSARH